MAEKKWSAKCFRQTLILYNILYNMFLMFKQVYFKIQPKKRSYIIYSTAIVKDSPFDGYKHYSILVPTSLVSIAQEIS